MVKDKSKKRIVAFIFVPAGIRGVRPSILENRTNYNDIKDDLDEGILAVKKNLLYDFVGGKEINKESLFDKEFLFEMKKKVLKLTKKGIPPISTHFLTDDNDIIMRTLLESGLDNSEDDMVKVVYYPIYLSGADGLLDQNYQQVMISSHLGVFPSSYEPWGYTPLECCANGVANITTDLAGFGRYVKDKTGKDHPGVFVIDRFGKEDTEVIKNMADVMYSFTKLSKKDRVENKISARKIAELADWSNLIENYFKAFELAVQRRWS